MSYTGNPDESSSGATHVGLGGHPSDIPSGSAAWYAANVAFNAREEAARKSTYSPSYTSSAAGYSSSSPSYSPSYSYGGSSGGSGTALVVLGAIIFGVYAFFSGSKNATPASPPEYRASQPPPSAALTDETTTSAVPAPLLVPEARQSRPIPAAPAEPPQPPAYRRSDPAALAAYYDQLHTVILQSIRYPKSARKNDEEGTCRIKVKFSRDGTILNSEITEGTGFEDLDAECMDVLGRIGRFPAVPPEANPDTAQFVVEQPITYTLS
jgi:TonB family protein